MKDFNGKTAVITGAGSGIGRALAIHLSGLGCHLVLADLNESGLHETVSLLNREITASVHRVDVGVREQVYQLAEYVDRERGGADLVINNAGVSTNVSIEDVEYDYFESLFQINFWGVVYGTKAFLPQLRRKAAGHIVNLASVDAFSAPPGRGPYAASKAAIHGFTETLAAELLDTNIGVSTVFPGAVRTSIAETSSQFAQPFIEKRMRENPPTEEEIRVFMEKAEKTRQAFEAQTFISAEEAAAIIINGVRENRLRIMVGDDAIFLDQLVREQPEGYLKVLAPYRLKP